MNKQSAAQVWRNAQKAVLLGLLALLLSACGTFEVGIEPVAGAATDNDARSETSITPTSVSPVDDAQPTATSPPTLANTAPAWAGAASQWSYQANDHSSSLAISADGRYVAFQSGASNLVPGDANKAGDIFVYDRKTRVMEMISFAEDGSQANDTSGEPDISADGRWVVFTSSADNLLPEIDEHTGENIADTNGASDIFVFDRLGAKIRRISQSSEGKQSNHNTNSPGISADGRWVTFWSLADNLASGASPGIYLHDRSAGTTQWIADGLAPTISADGRWIGFLPVLSDLVPDDVLYAALYETQTGEVTVIGGYANGGIQGWPSEAITFSVDGEWLAFRSTFNLPDGPIAGDRSEWGQQVWLRDQKTETLALVSRTPHGLPGNSISAAPSLCAEGRWIAF